MTHNLEKDLYGIAALQDKMLSIFKCFAKICKENNLRYCLAGGSCLGTLRHQGFIPWDDDLDVYMPRDDYERLWNLMNGKTIEGHYLLCRTSEDKNYHHRVMQLVDVNTTFIHSRCKDEDIEHGIYIDIIPLDACPDGKFQRFLQICNAVIFSICNIQCKPEYNGGKMTALMTLGTNILLSLIRSPKARYRVWKAAERRMTRYRWENCSHVKCITSTLHELLTPFPKEYFCFGDRRALFEDTEAIIPKNAEAYCKKMYGDYMALPPEEKRIVKHRTEYIDLENNYKKYRGIYYLAGK